MKDGQVTEVSRLEAELNNELGSEGFSLLAHDVRSSMFGLLGSLELIDEKGLSVETRDRLNRARTSGALLNDLLNLIFGDAEISTPSIPFNVSEEINYITDPFNHYDGYIGIEIRGHSSQDYFPKKQYGLETRNSEGENLNVSLFGIPKENDWVLYAPYSDKSLMRNVLAYDIARSLGSYAPRTQFCEVILNNDYVGIYVFMEKIKKDSNRVNIYDPEPDNLSGGYLLEVSVLSKIDTTDNYFESESQGRFFVIKFPDEDDITVDQIAWITNYINTFESTLYSGSFNDPDIGYYQYIDSPSWVDYILLNEAFRNNDVFYSSTYLHKKKNGKLFAGPVWDFNIAMGNIDYNDKIGRAHV